MKNLGVQRTAKMLERKISTRNMRREDESALANYELKQAKRDIARLEAELDATKDKLADMRHRMSAAFGAMEMAEKPTEEDETGTEGESTGLLSPKVAGLIPSQRLLPPRHRR